MSQRRRSKSSSRHKRGGLSARKSARGSARGAAGEGSEGGAGAHTPPAGSKEALAAAAAALAAEAEAEAALTPEERAAREAAARSEAKRVLKQAQKDKVARLKRARDRERAKVVAPGPGFSLPTLRTVVLRGCQAFSKRGVDRLLANAPMLRALDAAGCPLLVGDRRKAALEAAALASAGRKGGSLTARSGGDSSARLGSVSGGGSSHGGGAKAASTARSYQSSAVAGGAATGRSKQSGKGRRKKRKGGGDGGAVNWKAVAKSRPYCRAAPQDKGLSPSPDADALAWRDAYHERLALERCACRAVINTFRSFKFRRVYVVRHAAYVLTRYWRTLNIGILRVLRLYKRTMKARKMKRNFFLNTLCMYNAGRILQRLARGAVARLRARMRARLVHGSAIKIQRMLRRHWDWNLYFKEMAVQRLEDVEEDERFGFKRPHIFHHKCSSLEASQLRLVKEVPVETVRSPPKFTHDGTLVFSVESMEAMGTSYVGDMDVRRAFKAEPHHLRPAPSPLKSPGFGSPTPEDVERRNRNKQPLGMPPRPHSYYT